MGIASILFKTDGRIIHGYQTIIVNSSFVGITTKIFHNVVRVFEGLLAVNHPLFLIEGIHQAIEPLVDRKTLTVSMKFK